MVHSFDRKTTVYLFLSMFFVANTLIAEFVGAKLFSLNALIGTSGSALNMSVGVLLWPLGFVLTDIVNEYYGTKGVRTVSFITAGLILWSFVIVQTAIKLPPADFWVNLYNKGDNPLNIAVAYKTLLGTSGGIMLGSVTAFLLSQFVDAYVFQWFRKKAGDSHIWLRAVGSTVLSQIIDSFVILWIAFGLFGSWSFTEIISVGLTQYVYKIAIAILLTPLLYLAHFIIDKYFAASLNTP